MIIKKRAKNIKIGIIKSIIFFVLEIIDKKLYKK